MLFTLEYLLRLFACTAFGSTVYKFVKSPMNIIDVVAIAPTYLELLASSSNMPNLTIVRTIRLTRVFRIFKISRYSAGLKLMAESLKRSANILGILMFFMAIGVTLSSCAMFYAEKGD